MVNAGFYVHVVVRWLGAESGAGKHYLFYDILRSQESCMRQLSLPVTYLRYLVNLQQTL